MDSKTKGKGKPADTRRYRWSHPSEWLDDHIDGLLKAEDMNGLAVVTRRLASHLDGDQIQDAFQDEMSAAGYFRPVRR